MRDCANKIFHQEGVLGFFQGTAARVLRIAPQFGFSLLAYEYLAAQMASLYPDTMLYSQQVVVPPTTNAFVDPYDYRTAFSAPGTAAQSIQPIQRYMNRSTDDSFGQN